MTDKTLDPADRGGVKIALFCTGIFIVLIGSWLLPWSRAYWDGLDVAAFLRLNGSLENCPWWQRTIAFANSKAFDKIGTVCFLLLTLGFGFLCAPSRRATRISRMLAFGLFFALYWPLLSLFFDYVLEFDRLSPSLDPRTSHHTINLRVLVPDIKCKIDSTTCFPGGHAVRWTAVFLFFAFDRAWGWAAAAFMTAVVFCAPRLIGGGHWASDVLVGGIAFSLLSFALYHALPFHVTAERMFERLLYAAFRPLRIGGD